MAPATLTAYVTIWTVFVIRIALGASCRSKSSARSSERREVPVVRPLPAGEAMLGRRSTKWPKPG